MDVAPTDQFVVHPSVICRELSGETVLLNLESGVYYGLDAVGTRVWQLLMQGRTIAERLRDDDRGVRRRAGRAARRCLASGGELRERGIVTPREPAQA